jgi:hypothetical protein
VSVWETDEACAVASRSGDAAAATMPVGAVVVVDRRPAS